MLSPGIARSTALATSILVLLGTTGIPLPMGLPVVDEDFPCRNHACGCLDAEMCRTKCCCFKPKVVKKPCCLRPGKPSEQDQPAIPGLLIGALQCKGTTGAAPGGGITFFPPPATPVLSSAQTASHFAIAARHERLSVWDAEPPSPPPRA
jgi:hypothetical protein